jgi:hypothetical protein
MSQCSILKEVESKFGKPASTYLRNKHKGGTSNEKGAAYESNFAIFQLSKSCYQALTSEHEIHINSQTLAFVDDLNIVNKTVNSSCSYQLKNVQNITWTGGLHPLELDFQFHYELEKDKGIKDSSTVLTVSRPELYNKLSASIPDGILNHTDCTLFEDEALNISLIKSSELKKSLMAICSFNEVDKLTQLHTVMKGVWENNKHELTSANDFLQEVRNITPHFLRSFTSNAMLESRLVEIFDKIEGFSYEIFENKLKYSYSCGNNNSSFDGFIEIGSDDFENLSKVVIEENPSTFFELLGLELL